MSRRICVITGSRAEYGLLYPLMKEMRSDPDLVLQVVATGMHLAPEFGLTYRDIEADGLLIDAKVENLVSSDTALGVTKSIGLGIIGLAEALVRLAPHMVVVLGDRFEILAAAQATMILQIPLVHLGGGDGGSGTYDNIIRHCITKIASLHFVTHEKARRRVVQLGENPARVFCYGATSVDTITQVQLLSRAALEESLGIELKPRFLLVAFHPLTMDEASGKDQLCALLNSLDLFRREWSCSVVITKANADNGGRSINAMLAQYVAQRSHCHLFDSLGHVRYLSMMKHAAVVVGNSSSGIYEAPYLRTPTVDIGSRQRSREAPASVIRAEADEGAIHAAITHALTLSFDGVEMIYGAGDASHRILRKMKEFIDTPGLATKTFFDLQGES